eukprot:Lithocolla_globosa_v1_NODE_186_length_5337_cov_5.779712.p7 type:complete len:103 gc:universal NODE_186_length_5337_cov_5.779712:3789-3481(-)
MMASIRFGSGIKLPCSSTNIMGKDPGAIVFEFDVVASPRVCLARLILSSRVSSFNIRFRCFACLWAVLRSGLPSFMVFCACCRKSKPLFAGCGSFLARISAA